MDYQLNTRLNGNIAMTSSYHERASLHGEYREAVTRCW